MANLPATISPRLMMLSKARVPFEGAFSPLEELCVVPSEYESHFRFEFRSKCLYRRALVAVLVAMPDFGWGLSSHSS